MYLLYTRIQVQGFLNFDKSHPRSFESAPSPCPPPPRCPHPLVVVDDIAPSVCTLQLVSRRRGANPSFVLPFGGPGAGNEDSARRPFGGVEEDRSERCSKKSWDEVHEHLHCWFPPRGSM